MYSLFLRNVIDHPHNIGFVLSDKTTLTWQEASERVDSWSFYLLGKGVKRGDRVALLTQEEDLYVFLHLAVDQLNATFMALDSATPSEHLKHLPNVRLLLTDLVASESFDSFEDRLLALKHNQLFALDDGTPSCSKFPDIIRYPSIPNYLVSSSGTTASGSKLGRKWIPILSAGLLYWAEIEKFLLQLQAPYRVLCTRSPAYDARISEYVRAFAAGGTLVLLPAERRRDLQAILEECERHQITCLILIASQLAIPDLDAVIERLARAGLKHLMVTGDACSLLLKQLCEKHAIQLWNCYGPTEATFGMSILCVNGLDVRDENNQPIVPIGLPNSDSVRFHLIDECLYIESPFLSPEPGYIDEVELSAKNFPTLIINGKETRVFNTENRFSMSADGQFLIFKGRINADAHCKVAGVKVDPDAIEQCLEQYNQTLGRKVLHACVVIKTWNDVLKPVAYVVEQEPFSKSDFMHWLKQRLLPEEIPVLVTIPEFPILIPSDKIDRQALINREKVDSELFFNQVDPNIASADDLMQRLHLLWERVLGVKPNNNQQEFVFAGGDSFLLTVLCKAIQQEIMPSFNFRKMIQLPAINLHHIHKALIEGGENRPVMALIKQLTTIRPELINYFFLPPLLGEGYFTYKNLVVMFAKLHQCNVYGLSVDLALLPKSLRESAQRFVQAILSVQSQGPFHLLGFSFGATLAREVAEVLLEQGHTIGTIQIIDGLPPLVYQMLSRKAHATMLEELANFVIKTLNGKYYGEKLKSVRLNGMDAFDSCQQINKVFDHLQQRICNPQSRPVLALARQHLLFAQTAPFPRRLPVWVKLYFSNKDLPYLKIVSEIAELQRWPVQKIMHFWNAYFDDLVYAYGRDAETGHIELLQATREARLALYNYWNMAHDPLRNFPRHVRDFNPFYALEENPDRRTLHCKILGVTQEQARQISIPEEWQSQKRAKRPLFEYMIPYAHETDIRCSRRYGITFNSPVEQAANIHGFFQKLQWKRAKPDYSLLTKRTTTAALPGEPWMKWNERQAEQTICITLIILWNYHPLADLSFSCRTNPAELMPILVNRFDLHPMRLSNPVKGIFLLQKSYVDRKNPSTLFAMSVADELMNQLILLLEPLVSPGLKYNNLRRGVTPEKREFLNSLVFDINHGRLSTDRDEQLAVMDSLTLHANHLDQQTVDQASIEPGKRQIIIHWIEAAFTLAKRCLPDLETMIQHPNPDSLQQLDSRLLSSLAIHLHYLGKFRRYQPDSTPEQRLPFLVLALEIAKLLTLREQGDRLRDPHYYQERIITFMNPVWITLNQLGRHAEALQIILTQMEEAYRCNLDFHIIQGHNNLAEFNRKQPGAGDPDFSLKHAEMAIARVLENETIPGRESFIAHNIYYNARLEGIYALQAKAEVETDPSMIQEYLENALSRAKALQARPAGAKDTQLSILDALVGTLESRMTATNFSFKTT
jgi:thioesterase domain-containing protein/acyl-CoA synthetase (AMP-forming)/AMP-acid ligase II